VHLSAGAQPKAQQRHTAGKPSVQPPYCARAGVLFHRCACRGPAGTPGRPPPGCTSPPSTCLPKHATRSTMQGEWGAGVCLGSARVAQEFAGVCWVVLWGVPGCARGVLGCAPQPCNHDPQPSATPTLWHQPPVHQAENPVHQGCTRSQRHGCTRCTRLRAWCTRGEPGPRGSGAPQVYQAWGPWGCSAPLAQLAVRAGSMHARRL